MTTSPENPFAAAAVGEVYKRGRPYHHPRSLAHVRALVGDGDVTRALDIACGTGMSTIALAEFSRTVVGVDISAEMMRVAPAAPNVTYMLGEAERLACTDDAFDAVTCSSGVHWFDQQRFYAELRRVVRPEGWVALYDHYFVDIRAADGFAEWAAELFARYPLPPRNPQVGDPRSEVPDGFEVVGTDMFEDPITMTRAEFADYQITISSCVAAAERGTPRHEIRDWVFTTTEPLFGDSTLEIQFLGTITALRRLP